MYKKIITFGEIMLRLSPCDKGERLSQALSFRVEPGGSESNVAVALAHLGNDTGFVTALPAEENLTEKVLSYLRCHNVDGSLIVQCPGRLGIYWTENGIGPRNSFVVYDRESSAFSRIKLNNNEILAIRRSADWFHVSGITPAVSINAAEILKKVLKGLKKVPISIDLNYRSKLWNWTDSRKKVIARSYMQEICENAVLITANETDLYDILGYDWNFDKGLETARKMFADYKRLKYLAVSARSSISASENEWTGVLFIKNNGSVMQYKGIFCHITDIVDRVGTGDAFTAGIIHGILHKMSGQQIINFAVSLGALKHTIRGDASLFNATDVMHFIDTNGSGKIFR